MANTSNRLAGTADLSVDGQTYLVSGDFEYNPGLVSRESLAGMDQVHGYGEKPNVPHISCTLRDSGGLSVAALNAMTDVSISATLANGKVIVGRNMWTVESQTAKAADANIEVKWEGLTGSVTEQ